MALYGAGSMQEAFNEVAAEGGAFSAVGGGGRYYGGWTTTPTPGETAAVNALVADILSKYDVDEGMLRNMIQQVRNYDTFLMNGNNVAAYDMKKSLSPAEKKVFGYLRRRAHTWGSKPQRLTKAERDALKAKRTQARETTLYNLRHLADWTGSDPYSGTLSRTMGSYKFANSLAGIPRSKRYQAYPGIMTRRYRIKEEQP